MKVFVTGAAGGMGTAICRALLAAHHTVIGMTHTAAHVEVLRARGVEPLLADMRDPATYQAHAAQADAIIHTADLALPLHVTRGAIRKAAAADVVIVDALTAAARGGSVKALVYTSGVLVYGAGEQPRLESDAPRAYPLCEHKVRSEQVVVERARRNEAPWVVLRPGATYGTSGLFMKQFIAPIVAGKRARFPGRGMNRISYIHSDDLAQAYVRAVEHPKPGEIFNVCDNEPVPLRVILEEIAKQLSAPAPGPLPSFVVRLALGLFAEPLLSPNVMDNRKMQAELGLKLAYPTYREGVAAIVAELKGATARAA